MSRLAWYWHRLRAMGPGEIACHLRKKLRQSTDARRTAWPAVDFACPGVFPDLPNPAEAPPSLRTALRQDVDNILAGRWRFFGHLDLQVESPPQWQRDYLAGRDLANPASAFRLNYRTLPDGVDSKLIWEPSRWYQLVRLAMGAYVLRDQSAAITCLDWLEDWVRHNPPYRGWNWTSALEVGLRLIQFTWIDALLVEFASSKDDGRAADPKKDAKHRGSAHAGTVPERLAQLRPQILPAHVWYAWRHRSFGSSANNHLLGELVGCLVATARWPGLVRCGTSLAELQRRWEHEVLTQFAPDGGNREQALNYQLFSWEFCWQARLALVAAGRPPAPEVEERLRRAAGFFTEVQMPEDPWDYGDSDNAFVTPFFANDATAVTEWHRWFRDPSQSPALSFWLGHDFRSVTAARDAGGWRHFPDSGHALRRPGDWTLRWDLSPLGLGSMAAHGHLDAQHLSIWVKGVAMIIDPGTGAYHADKPARTWLASRAAHNGPAPTDAEWPKRLGPFLWEETHAGLDLKTDTALSQPTAELSTPTRALRRSLEITHGPDGGLHSVIVRDHVESRRENDQDTAGAFSVRWQFPPDATVETLAPRRLRVRRREVALDIEVSAAWSEVFCIVNPAQVAQADPESPLAGTVSPAFRRLEWGPYLKLVAGPKQPTGDDYTTRFFPCHSTSPEPA